MSLLFLKIQLYVFTSIVTFFAIVFLIDRDRETGQLQLMVNFVTKGDKKELLQPLVDLITAAFPQVVTKESFSFCLDQYDLYLTNYNDTYYGIINYYVLMHLSHG